MRRTNQLSLCFDAAISGNESMIIFENLNVLATGGAGYIVSHGTQKLLESENDLIVVEELLSGDLRK